MTVSKQGCSQLDGRKSDCPYTGRCQKGKCCRQLQTNSLLETSLEIIDYQRNREVVDEELEEQLISSYLLEIVGEGIQT